ncbi:MAG: ATP-binding protein, partial [Pygmaiobacter sp.]
PARFRFRLEGDIAIKEYYDFFIVLNNLIINAAQAGATLITAELSVKNESISMCVSDNAEGIPEDILPCIFQPGFSTKFDEQTGVLSPGLGLCHVKDIIGKWNAQIIAKSSVPGGTTFTIEIPSLQKEENS